jgi:hypothetical protein
MDHPLLDSTHADQYQLANQHRRPCRLLDAAVDRLQPLGPAGNRLLFTVDQTGKNPAGNFTGPFALTSLAISPAGQPAISYYDRANGTIKCAIGTVTQTVTGGLFAFLRDLLMLRWFR